MDDTRRIIIGATACLAALAGTALAQTGIAKQEGRIRFEGQETTDNTKVRQHIIVRRIENGREVEVEVKDGQTTATIDGQPVPKDRIRRNESGLVEILDEHGNVTASFMLGDAQAFSFGDDGSILSLIPRFKSTHDSPFLAPDDAMTLFGVQPEITSPPPVMIGITMAEPGESLREHFGLAEGEGILIASVSDGTPAAQAGLRPHDVIVRIDGQKPATPERLRELLRSRKPGDTLTLTVLQAGQKKDVEIVLAPYDAQRLGAAVPEVPGAPSAPNAFYWGERFGDTQQLRELALKLRERLGDLGEEFTPEIKREIHELLRRLTDEGVQLRRRFDEGDAFWQRRIAPPAHGGRLFVQPPQPPAQAAPDRGMDDRLSRLEDRLDQLERSIDRLVNTLERNIERDRER